MSKITFNRVVSNFGFKTAFNNLLERIEQEFQDKVLYRNNPSGEANSMYNDLDMSGRDILNVRNIGADGLLVDGKNVYQTIADATAANANIVVSAAFAETARLNAEAAAEALRLSAEAAAAALPNTVSDDGDIKIAAINTADGGGSSILATGITSGLKIGTTNSQPLHFYINGVSQGYFSVGGAFIVGTSPKTGYRNITVQNTQAAAGSGASVTVAANASTLSIAVASSVDGNNATITNTNGAVIVGTGSANPVALTVNSVTRLLVDSTGDCGVVSPTNKLGYVGGAGGSVIQSTSKSTNVTLNKPCGQITLNSASLAANSIVGFGLVNSTLKATDVLNITQTSPDTANYNIWVYTQTDGIAFIAIKNITGVALAEEIVLNFAVLKGVVA